MGCSIASLPGTCLGLPLSLKLPNSFWESLVDRFNLNLLGWKDIFLRQLGKVNLLKSFLEILPTYSLSLFKILAKYADVIERFQRNFIWTKIEEKKRLPLLAWEFFCK